MVERAGQSSVVGNEDAHVLPIRDLLAILWKRLWVIALLMVVFAGVSVGISLMQPPVYQASIKILVGQERGLARTPYDVNGLQEVTATVAQAVNSRPIAEAVIEQENLSTDASTFLAERLEVSAIEDTQFVTVSYKDNDPQRAQRVANAIGDVFSDRIADINPDDNESSFTVTVWEDAAAPGGPVSPNPIRNGLLALLIGAVLGTVLAFLLEFLDDSWRSPEEAEQVSGVPTFGAIPAFSLAETRKKGRKQL